MDPDGSAGSAKVDDREKVVACGTYNRIWTAGNGGCILVGNSYSGNNSTCLQYKAALVLRERVRCERRKVETKDNS